MNNLTEFGGGDTTFNYDEETVIRSIKQYNGAKIETKAEITSIHEIVNGFKQNYFNVYSNIIRDRNTEVNEVLKSLCDCDAELKFISDYNKQVLQIFESWILHEQEKFKAINLKVVEIANIIKDFCENSQASDEGRNKENYEIMSAMTDKLNKVYERFVVHRKKAQLEDFVKKLIQHEDLF